MSTKKLFWWSLSDPRFTGPAVLYCVEIGSGSSYEQKFSPNCDIPDLLEQGYVEISANTAQQLGLPT